MVAATSAGAWIAWVGGGIIMFAAVLGSLATIWRKLIRPSIDLVEMVGDLKTMMPGLEKAMKELEPNGGSSLVDRVHRIDAATGAVLDRLNAVEAERVALNETVARVEKQALHLERHANQFTQFEKYQRGRNHLIGNWLQRIILGLHRRNIALPDDADVPALPAADPPFPGDDPELVPDEFPLNPQTREED